MIAGLHHTLVQVVVTRGLTTLALELQMGSQGLIFGLLKIQHYRHSQRISIHLKTTTELLIFNTLLVLNSSSVVKTLMKTEFTITKMNARKHQAQKSLTDVLTQMVTVQKIETMNVQILQDFLNLTDAQILMVTVYQIIQMLVQIQLVQLNIMGVQIQMVMVFRITKTNVLQLPVQRKTMDVLGQTEMAIVFQIMQMSVQMLLVLLLTTVVQKFQRR